MFAFWEFGPTNLKTISIWLGKLTSRGIKQFTRYINFMPKCLLNNFHKHKPNIKKQIVLTKINKCFTYVLILVKKHYKNSKWAT